MQARLASQVTLSSVLIDQATFLEVLVVRIHGTEHKLAVQVGIKLSIESGLKADNAVQTFGAWATCVASDLVQALVAFDLDPAASSQSSPHSWVAYRYTEVFFALLRHECLIQRLWFGRPRTSMLICDNVVLPIVSRHLIVSLPIIIVIVPSIIARIIIDLTTAHDLASQCVMITVDYLLAIDHTHARVG